MKVRKETTLDIDNALDSLHLSNPLMKKRRRLSGISGIVTHAPIIEENTVQVDIISNEGPDDTVRKSTRKKSTPVRWDPQNCAPNTSASNTINSANIKDYYLNKTVNIKSTALETIHEEAAGLNRVMGNRKFRRFLQFDKVTKCKMKRRNDKVQRFKISKKTIKATIEDLHKKLKTIEQDC